MRQSEKVLNYMKEFGTISTFEAFVDLGVTRLSGRIYELREQGYNISSEYVTLKNRAGENVTFKKYRLEK